MKCEACDHGVHRGYHFFAAAYRDPPKGFEDVHRAPLCDVCGSGRLTWDQLAQAIRDRRAAKSTPDNPVDPVNGSVSTPCDLTPQVCACGCPTLYARGLCGDCFASEQRGAR